MKKITLATEKLYFGFPIFILGYKDDKWGYNFTTCSSSYTLGDKLNIGLSNQGNAMKQIAKSNCFTLNIPTKEQMKQIIIGGFNSGADKFNFPESFHFELSEIMDAPIISECCLTIECQVDQMIETENHVHIFASIKRRLVEESLIHEHHLDCSQLNPILYMGDSHERKYRYLSPLEKPTT
ncbi:flavin reductase family protein [Isobaculum melis]|uniref:NADH-FMN oxidoreductase RutF, flavin reductase (DIM6/NTAB) family n=1 Tax=Isobaculum melis TaxID=142588 RepID=A0A1H9U6M8_9LACT|nr:flavin reductase [Isobaculum melis]SES04878.1 NADH-FMN oxidoreductase RutF, flavin reductase (DIM6/NTAB) family [Isobaculum melis]